jgi:hypothetical protein
MLVDFNASTILIFLQLAHVDWHCVHQSIGLTNFVTHKNDNDMTFITKRLDLKMFEMGENML